MACWFSEKSWKLAHGREIELGPKAIVIGILNVTPDSFSDGGRYESIDRSVAKARRMLAEGAAIIEALKEEHDMLVSIDTYRASTAKRAVEAGAHIINDVWGFRKDPEIASVASQTNAGVCAMHTGREREKAEDVIEDQEKFLKQSISALKSAGVTDHQIVLDPGFGFAKDPTENIELLDRLDELHGLGYPLLIGTSRKRFIGYFTDQDAQNRDIGTAATSVVARMKGGAVFRVHDVPSNRDALAMADAVIAIGQGN